MAIYHSEKEFLHSFERYNALSSPKLNWHTSLSENVHRCEFGCTIPSEEQFFKKPLDAEGEHTIKVCYPCMEHMVYLTVDTDLHAKEITTHLKIQQHARERKLKHPLHL